MSGKKGMVGSGGQRQGAGRPREYIYKKVPIRGFVQVTEPAQLTPESDLTIQLAEMEHGHRGIKVGDLWYGYSEALAIACYVEEHRQWLEESPE